MPLARILTHQEADAATLCEYLRTLGYVVEVAPPGLQGQADADVEIQLDRIDVRQALEYASQKARDLECSVWVAPGAIPAEELKKETILMAPTGMASARSGARQSAADALTSIGHRLVEGSAIVRESGAVAWKQGLALGRNFVEHTAITLREQCALWQTARQDRRERRRQHREAALRERTKQEQIAREAMEIRALEDAARWSELAEQRAARQSWMPPQPTVKQTASPANAQPPTREDTNARHFWSWSTTRPEAMRSQVLQPHSLRELQWRRAAATSAVLALGLTLGFAAGTRRNASPLLPNTEANAAAEAPAALPVAESATSEEAMVQTVSSRQGSVPEAMPQSDANPIDAKVSNSPSPKPAVAPVQTSGSKRRSARRSGDYVAQDVVIRHFGKRDAGVDRSKQAKTSKDGVKRYSDLD
ncbi:MAG: hypothetical protein AB7O65_01030 [Candidatus Korobacteraceae bacterium]